MWQEQDTPLPHALLCHSYSSAKEIGLLPPRNCCYDFLNNEYLCPCQISRQGKAANHFFLAWRTRRASAGCAGPTPRPGRRQRSGGCRTAGRTPRRRRCAPGRRRGGSDAAFLSKITDHWPLFSVSLNPCRLKNVMKI